MSCFRRKIANGPRSAVPENPDLFGASCCSCLTGCCTRELALCNPSCRGHDTREEFKAGTVLVRPSLLAATFCVQVHGTGHCCCITSSRETWHHDDDILEPCNICTDVQPLCPALWKGSGRSCHPTRQKYCRHQFASRTDGPVACQALARSMSAKSSTSIHLSFLMTCI